MQDETTPQPPDNSQDPPAQPAINVVGHKVIQPSPELVKEMQAQQQVQPQPAVVGSDIPHQPAAPQPVYPQPNTIAQSGMPVGVSASQMGWSQSKSGSSFNFKGFIVKSLVGLVVVGGIFVALVFTNIIALSQFKTVNYTNSSGTHYSLTFYTKHTTGTLKTGNTELVSKVSEGGKYPLILFITSGPLSDLNKNGIKTCDGPLPKVFDVQNNNLNQTISVCSFPSTNGGPVGVYIAGFSANNKANIVTISQDLSGVDTSSQAAAQQSLPKFGLDTYQDDIKQIIASIKVQ